MPQELGNIITLLLGLEAEDLSITQMALRAIIVYVAALLMVRLGEKRLLGKNTALMSSWGSSWARWLAGRLRAHLPSFPASSRALSWSGYTGYSP